MKSEKGAITATKIAIHVFLQVLFFHSCIREMWYLLNAWAQVWVSTQTSMTGWPHKKPLSTMQVATILAGARAIIKVLGHQHWWLAGGYDLEIGHFQMWLVWGLPGGYIVAYLRSVYVCRPPKQTLGYKLGNLPGDCTSLLQPSGLAQVNK